MRALSSILLVSIVVSIAVAPCACGSDGGGSVPAGSGGSQEADASPEAQAGTGGAAPDASSQDATDATGESATSDVQQDTTMSDADAGSACPRNPGPADADRFVVISHPYTAGGDPSHVYEILKLTAAGVLSSTGKTFEMGRSVMGDMVFTPDGKIGIVVQEDGTLGEFELEADGTATVLDQGFHGSFYAGRLVMAPSGDRVYVLDSEWADIGGGVYEVAIGCDGALTDEGRILEAKLPYTMTLLPGDPGSAVLAAKDVAGAAPGDDAVIVELAPSVSPVASVDAFPDDEQIVASATRTPDGKYVLLGDNAAYSGIDNRVAVLHVDGATLIHRQTLTPLLDPISMVPSPYGSTVLVVSGFGDGIFVLDYDPANATSPFTVRGELAYDGKKPQLPGQAVMIERGALTGRVLVAENTAVRMVQFTAQGAGVMDLGPWSTGAGLAAITGAIGVQP